jgi:hypothetical protein
MKHLFSTLFVLVCMYNVDCPHGQVCAADSSGHGLCVKNEPGIPTLTGARGEACNFNYDCQPGLLCAKKRIGDWGVCQSD